MGAVLPEPTGTARGAGATGGSGGARPANERQSVDDRWAADARERVSEKRRAPAASADALGAGWEATEHLRDQRSRRCSRRPHPHTGALAIVPSTGQPRALSGDLPRTVAGIPSGSGEICRYGPSRSTNWATAAPKIARSSRAITMVVPGRISTGRARPVHPSRAAPASRRSPRAARRSRPPTGGRGRVR